ncbi:hypothetical protein [Rickettsia endosymbiont of Halotydeus destructor]|uniref:hypothetical protein n=1 Tax=Rickettsia endosymbiont of Halotydeus destructor TaxID=2996754 RepID=UPI003BAF7D98
MSKNVNNDMSFDGASADIASVNAVNVDVLSFAEANTMPACTAGTITISGSIEENFNPNIVFKEGKDIIFGNQYELSKAVFLEEASKVVFLGEAEEEAAE